MKVVEERAGMAHDASPNNQKETRKGYIAGRLQLTVNKMGQYLHVLFGVSDFPFTMLGECLPASLPSCLRLPQTPCSESAFLALSLPPSLPLLLPPPRLTSPVGLDMWVFPTASRIALCPAQTQVSTSPATSTLG